MFHCGTESLLEIFCSLLQLRAADVVADSCSQSSGDRRLEGFPALEQGRDHRSQFLWRFGVGEVRKAEASLRVRIIVQRREEIALRRKVTVDGRDRNLCLTRNERDGQFRDTVAC